jgi:proline iminopeptidase
LRYTLLHPERVARLVYLSGTGLGRPRDTNRRHLVGAMALYRDRIDRVLRSAPSPERDW